MGNRWIAVLGGCGLVCAGGTAAVPDVDPVPQAQTPALVVLLSVDQMRADYLTRFQHEFDGGFRRLLDGGVYFTDVRHDHAFTATAPGHATLVTGVHPSRHGIVSNDWWDRKGGRRVYAVEDSESPLVGFENLPGRSPANLLVPAVGDWLKDASPDSRVVSVAIKDRVAITMGGKQPDAVFWYEYQSGRYTTSTYYDSRVPEWLTVFNDSGPVHDFVNTEWTRLYPEERYDESREDNFAPEGETSGPVFPHKIVGTEDGMSSAFAELTNTPFGDVVTFALVREVVTRYELGQDEQPDFLAIGASSADLVGHRYGAYSQEIQDYYLRLDRELDAFMTFLDQTVGEGRWHMVLTADHGVATMPEESQRRGVDARRLTTADFQDAVIAGLQNGIVEAEIFAQPRPVLIAPLGLTTAFAGDDVTDEQGRTFRQAVAQGVAGSDVVAGVLTYDRLLRNEPVGDSELWRLFRNSFHPDRAADVVIYHPPNYVYPGTIPATHGSPWEYDSRVPLIVYGLPAKQVDRPVTTVDIAPTIATMLGITPPGDLDGRVLEEVKR